MIEAVCVKALIIPFVCLLMYAGLIIVGMTYLPFWKWPYLKDIVMWVFFVGVPVCFKAAQRSIEDYFFRDMLIDNVKWTAVLEFLMGSFTFSLFGELALQFVLVFLLRVQSSCKQHEKAASLKTAVDWIIAISGCVLIILTVNVAVETYADLGIMDYIVSFLIPLVLSILYLPVAYCMAVYSKYDTIYFQMERRNKDDIKTLRSKKRKIFFYCGLSGKKLIEFDKWYTAYICSIRSANDDDSFLELAYQYFANKQ